VTLGVTATGLPAQPFAQTQAAAVRHFSLVNFGIAAGVALVIAISVGYVAHAIMGDRAWGPRLNCLAAIVGAWSALALFDGAGTRGLSADAIVAIFGSVVFVAGASGLKALAFGQAGNFLPWRRRKVSAAYQRVLDPPPAGPPAHRLRAAVRKPTESDHDARNDNAAAGAPISNGVASDQNRLSNSLESTR